MTKGEAKPVSRLFLASLTLQVGTLALHAALPNENKLFMFMEENCV